MKFVILTCLVSMCMGQQSWMLNAANKEVSVNGVSYWVDSNLADEIALLPPHEKLARIQRKLQSGTHQLQKEVSINGVSYLVDGALADSVAGLPAGEQLSRIQRFLSMGRTNRMQQQYNQQLKKEVSINGVSYLVDEDLADEIAVLPPDQQMGRVQRFLKMGHTSRMWSKPSQQDVSYMLDEGSTVGEFVGMPAGGDVVYLDDEELTGDFFTGMKSGEPMTRGFDMGLSGLPQQLKKEISINGVSYLVDEDLADELAGLPSDVQFSRVQNFLGMGATGRSWTSNQKEISIDGIAYLIDENLADELAMLPSEQQLNRVKQFLRMGKTNRMWQQPSQRMWQQPNQQKAMSINGVEYLVDVNLADELAGLPSDQQMTRVQRFLSGRSTRASTGQAKVVSIDGVSYLVDEDLADEIAVLPASEKLVRIQMGKQSLPLYRSEQSIPKAIQYGAMQNIPTTTQRFRSSRLKPQQLKQLINNGVQWRRK